MANENKTAGKKAYLVEAVFKVVALEEALALLKKGIKILTNNQMDKIVMDEKTRKEYYAYLPAWTGTQIEYKGTKCKITERGKVYYFTMPEKNGWYETNKLGLPFGKPSNSDNPKARYLYRIDEYKGLLSRSYGWDGYGGRGVIADGSIYRCGVLGVRKTQTKTRRR